MTNFHGKTLGSLSGLNMVGWDVIVSGVILEEDKPVTPCQLSIHPSIHPGEGCRVFWKLKKGKGKERLLHPSNAFFLLNPTSFLPQSPRFPSHVLQSSGLPLTSISIPPKDVESPKSLRRPCLSLVPCHYLDSLELHWSSSQEKFPFL